MLHLDSPETALSGSSSAATENNLHESLQSLSLFSEKSDQSQLLPLREEDLFTVNQPYLCSHIQHFLELPLKPRILRILNKLTQLSIKAPVKFEAACQQRGSNCSFHNAEALLAYFFCGYCERLLCPSHSKMHHLLTGHDVFVNGHSGQVICFKCDKNVQQDVTVGKPIDSEQKQAVKRIIKKIVSAVLMEDGENAISDTSSVISCKGMHNLGNTCYFNSTVQALRSSWYVETFMRRNCTYFNNYTSSAFVSLLSLFNQFYKKDKKHVDSSTFVRYFASRWKVVRSKQQQDPHEFLVLLLDSLKEEIASLCDDEVLQDFNEMLQSCFSITLKCNECLYSSEHKENFLCVSLPLPQFTAAARCEISLDFIMKEFFRPFVCEYQCEKCTSTRMTYSIQTVALPNVLILHLKRFSVQHVEGKKKGKSGVLIEKNRQYVSFDFLLRAYVENGLGDEGIEVEYELSAVIVHYGDSCNSGHYISYAKVDCEWFYCSDDSVKRVMFSEVQNTEAYILVYNKLN